MQGLRALAVILVILAHARIPGFSGGFIGVDVFFVISGYVISGLLIREERLHVRQKLLTFYARRARRILPAASVTLIVTLWGTYHWLGSIAGREIGVDERWASLFGANWRFINVKTNYLQALQPPSVILHFWSLSVEEQFYFVFPVLVFSIWACVAGRQRTRVLVTMLIAIIAVSAWWCGYQTHTDPVTAYYSPFTRVWELALGSLMLVLPKSVQLRSRAVNAVVGWVALASLVVAALVITTRTSYPGVTVWWPVASTGVLLWAGRNPTDRGPELLLARRPAMFIGDISYSLYLWHYPLLMIPMQYAVTGSISVVSRLELIAASLVLAVLSYYLIENPVRRSTFLVRRPAANLAMGGALVGSVWVATLLFEHIAFLRG